MIRGLKEPVPHRDRPYTFQQVDEWREAAHDAGRPDGLDDFYAAHGLCVDCMGHGTRMAGWRMPASPEEVERAKELHGETVPFWEVCPACQGSGAAPPPRDAGSS